MRGALTQGHSHPALSSPVCSGVTLALRSEITLAGLRGPDKVSGIEPGARQKPSPPCYDSSHKFVFSVISHPQFSTVLSRADERPQAGRLGEPSNPQSL